MKINLRKDLIKVTDDFIITVSEAIEILSKLSAEEIVETFSSELKFPKIYRMKILSHVLIDEVNKIQILDDSLGSELNYRLKYFDHFSEFQLVELLERRSNKLNDLTKHYKEDIWIMLLQVANQLNVSDDKLKQLIIKAKNLEDNKQDLKHYNNVLDQLFSDKQNEVSGLTINDFKQYTLESTTVSELRIFASKEQLTIPKSLTKQQILDNIIIEANKKYPNKKKETFEKLNKMTILQLKRYAINEDLKVVFDMKKEVVIKLIVDAYTKNPYSKVVLEKPFNIPPRIKPTAHTKVEEIVREVEVDDNVVVNDTAQTVSNGHNQPFQINVYYDGVRQGETVHTQKQHTIVQEKRDINIKLDETSKTEEELKKETPLWLIIIYAILGIIIGTIIYVIILDLTNIVPYDSNPVSEFIYRILFGK